MGVSVALSVFWQASAASCLMKSGNTAQMHALMRLEAILAQSS